MKKTVAAWYATPLGRLGTAAATLLAAYLCATYAIGSANLWAYGTTLVLVLFSARFVFLAGKRR